MKRPVLLYVLCLVLALIGLSALAGGAMMIIKPDGSLLGMHVDWLNSSPFRNFLLPGIFLSCMLGLFPLFVISGLLFHSENAWADKLNLYPDKHWSWALSLYAGIIIIIWILIQMFMTRYFWLQPVIISAGLLIIILTLFPVNIKYSESHNTQVKPR